MIHTRRWLLAVVVLSCICSPGPAQDVAPWKTLQAGGLCLRFPPDWYDMTPIIRPMLLPDLLARDELAGIELPAAVMRLPSAGDGEPDVVLLLLAPGEAVQQLLAGLGTGSELIERSEGVVAGEPGIYEKYTAEDPEGSSWLVYTKFPRPDGRHVVLLALSPRESPVPETVIREILAAAGPCPTPTEPPCTCGERVAALERDLQELRRAHEAEVAAMKDSLAALGREVERLRRGQELRIGVVDAETLFTRVFLPQVQTERAAMEAKAREIQTLTADFQAGKIKQDVYQQRYLKLQAELIQASLKVNLTMLDKMIASPGFLNLRADLENVRTQAKPISDEVVKVVKESQVTILDLQGFSERLQQLQAAFQQLDQLLTQVAAVKILEISQQIAKEKGYDLVLRTKDVVMFRRESTIVDLSPEVEARLWALFRLK